ncbi:amino acid adenylation domain-containing protein [Bacillus safensis]|uniref:non-ribosomal peptide synthetase n=1 Tax=Bacillus safensis TaxID=561879 RepID=UPI002DB92A64|nr:non-ribosomal peptide synthetase [Bacillus safensis]MEC1410286.1 amino acid adenylation domain-containing protein [Bacillus safensis]
MSIQSVDSFPLTGAQSGIWYAQQLDPANPIFNTAEYIDIKGPIDPIHFEAAIRKTVLEADSLYMRFVEDTDGPKQWMTSKKEIPFQLIHLQNEKQPLDAAKAWMKADLSTPVSLEKDVLFREVLFQLADDRFIWYQRIHHIAIDGFAFSLIARRVAEVYSALSQGTPVPPQTFGALHDVVEEESTYRQSNRYEADRTFWKNRFADQPEIVSLAELAPRTSDHFIRKTAGYDAEKVSKMKKNAQAFGGTWHEMILAASALYMHRMTGAHDIVLGLPVMMRLGSCALQIPGMVMNLVPLRLTCKPEMTLSALVRQVSDELKAIRPHQRYRHEDMRRDFKLIGRNQRLFGPQINIMPFDYNLMFDQSVGQAHNLSAGPVDDISINIYDRADGNGFQIDFDANPAVYKEQAVDAHQQRFLQLLEEITGLEQDQTISQFNLLLSEEKENILKHWNDTKRELPEESLRELFEKQVSKTPQAKALQFEGITLTYEELNKRANQLAHYLKKHDIGPEQFVAIALPRSINMVVSLLAVVKTGAAYLPLDPDYPNDRVAYMLEDAKPACLLTVKETADGLDHPHIVQLDDATVHQEIADSPHLNPTWSEGSPHHPAYILYTSGSTGKPKGVVVTKRNVINFILSMQDSFLLDQEDQLLAVTTIAFDISGLEMFLPLLHGAAILLAKKETIQEPAKLSDMIRSHHVTIMQATPTLWHALADEYPDVITGMRVLVGGEALPASLLHTLQSLQCDITNLYGPTETTIWSTMENVTAHRENSGPAIGKPIWNTSIYILDEGLNPVPAGSIGELYIAGEGVSRGYLGRYDLTAERFVADPFGTKGTRMYRTGDLARWREDGSIDYISRADHQIKIRGFRIELGEIETVMMQHQSIKHTSVIVREDQPGQQLLCAYVVLTDGSSLHPSELRQFAAALLPDYMVPSAVVVLPELPLTPNGKIDRKALPAPNMSLVSSERTPRTPQEDMLCSLFAETLGLSQIGIDDSFFDLGGHSLLAARLLRRIRDTLGADLSMSIIFESPRVAELAQHIDKAKDIRPPLQVEDKPDEIPLSFAQKRLWFLHCLEGPSPTYNIPLVIQLTGTLDQTALIGALADITEKHETLRTIFPNKNGMPRQVILHPKSVQPELHVTASSDQQIENQLNEAIRYSFQIEEEPALRAELFTLDAKRSVLLLLLHHIAGDGWSLAPLTRDLAAAYEARIQGKSISLPAEPVQYADYAIWQQKLLGSEEETDSLFAKQLSYWKGALHDLPEELELPYDFPRPQEGSFNGATIDFTIEPALHQNLLELAKQYQVSLFMVLQASLAALLTRLGAGTDIPIGSPIAGRNDDALDDIVGLFVNTLVLRTNTAGNPTFSELLKRVRDVDLAAYEHQDLPFERLVEILNPTRSRSRNPLFQVMLAFQNTPKAEMKLTQLDSDLYVKPVGSAKFDLTIELTEQRTETGSAAGLTGLFEFSTDVFKQSTIRAIADRMKRFLTEVTERPHVPIGQVNILSDKERQTFLPDKKTFAQLDQAHSLPALFEKTAEQYPDRVAVTDGKRQLTYEELNNKANRLAHLLIEKGVGPEQFVALALPRSIDMLVSLLAVHKAGAAYVPLDPDYPADRLAYMIQDAKPVCSITTKADAVHLPADCDLILLDEKETSDQLLTMPNHNPADIDRIEPLSSLHPAYIIYTSGSTGKPKGVVIPHQNVIRLLTSTEHWFQFDEEDVWTMFHSYAFDFSVWEIWGPLLYGGRLVIVPHTISRSPEEMLQLLVEEGVTVLNQTPSAFYQLMQIDKEQQTLGQALSLRYVIFGGEALELSRLEDWYSRHSDCKPKLINMYGITETTVHVTYNELNRDMITKNSSSLIGEPIPDLHVYVLDEYLQPVPPGTTGEMYVAGAGLARGYLGRPDLTSDRFPADPYGAPGTRMYRTGDLAHWTEEGALDYIGRADHQIKIRGFRIELGEIEAVLARHDTVAQVAVMMREDQPGDKRLVAYIVPTEENHFDTETLRQFAAASLPDYMVPAAYVQIDTMPLTANGKLDQKSLPAPQLHVQQTDGRGPRNPKEEILCHLFEEVLDLPKISIDDRFFDIGGHSLLAVRLISRIRDALGVKLSIGTLFEAPNVASLAEKLETGSDENALDILLPLRTNGERYPLFCVHPAGGLSWCYAGLLNTLEKDIPIYGLQARGIARKDDYPHTLDDMAADYIKHIQTIQPKGPYHLLGWSLGGNVVQAMATQLQQQGEEIALVAMLDAYPNHFLPIKAAPDEEEALIALLALGGYDPDTLTGEPLTMKSAIDILKKDGSALASLSEDAIRNLKETYVNSVRLLGEYQPKTYQGDILFFRSTIIPDWFTPIDPEAWTPYINGTIEQHDIHCRHKDMCQPKPLAEIGVILDNALHRVKQKH